MTAELLDQLELLRVPFACQVALKPCEMTRMIVLSGTNAGFQVTDVIEQ